MDLFTRFIQTNTCRNSILTKLWVEESTLVVGIVAASFAAFTVVLEFMTPWGMVVGAILSRYTVGAITFEE